MPFSMTLAQSGLTVLLIALGAALVGAVIGGVCITLFSSRGLRQARTEAERITESARSTAETKARQIELDAEKQALERRKAFDREVSDALAELKKSQDRAARREEILDRKLEQIGQREEKLDQQEARIQSAEEAVKALHAEADSLRIQLRDRLSEVARLTEAEARAIYLDEVKSSSLQEAAKVTQSIIEEAETKARDRAREITLMAIQRYAAESVSDSTIRTVKIPSDDMKGRIIGREGRNIRAIEKATGADILIDDTPGVISVSCFDKVRQTIAAETLQKLVADGRVHPSRVEELVEQTKRDVNDRIQKAGTEAVTELGLRGLHPKVVEAMGRLQFRTSYGQNVLKHSIEVAYLAQMIADQLGLNGQIARRAGFLHDIGKAMDHEVEGGHPAIGMDFLRKFGEKSEAVLNAVGGHHADIPSTTPYTPIVMAADAVSGARPGARRESMEMYIKRLEQLESIAKAHSGVTEAFAIQAGREVRVIVDAKRLDDATTFVIARDIAKRVEEEMTFPGEIKVTVLREVRAEATAR
ncbi:MAG: ribonuclease Y [Phycisphaeraceae bacterium]|nr:ribonuclease Y [Phycisphaeraceae bacterium]